MKNLELPKFNIPLKCESPSRKPSMEEYQKWIEENVADLKKQGVYQKYRNDPLRCPVNVRFTLHEGKKGHPL